MKREFNFESLVELCERTHEETQYAAVRAVDRTLVARNWLFGWYIVEFEGGGSDRREIYGKQLIGRLSYRLRASGVKGCSQTNLWKFREFYQVFRDIPQTLSVESLAPRLIGEIPSVAKLAERFVLGWSHYVTLLSVSDPDARRFYEIEAVENDWSVRELRRQLASSLYERLALSRDKEEIHRLAREGQVIEKPSDLVKDPVVMEFLGLEERPSYSESDLETAIIDRLQQFLLELGKGFLFEARQKRFSFEDRHFFVDLVFYNRLLRCYVLIDLKRGELTHQDLGQMQMYVNYFDRYMKADGELPTVGILLCDRKDDAIVQLTLPKDTNIYASKYQLYLPSRQQLAAQLEEVRRELEQGEERSDG